MLSRTCMQVRDYFGHTTYVRLRSVSCGLNKKSPHCAVGYDGLNRFGSTWVLSLWCTQHQRS